MIFETLIIALISAQELPKKEITAEQTIANNVKLAAKEIALNGCPELQKIISAIENSSTLIPNHERYAGIRYILHSDCGNKLIEQFAGVWNLRIQTVFETLIPDLQEQIGKLLQDDNSIDTLIKTPQGRDAIAFFLFGYRGKLLETSGLQKFAQQFLEKSIIPSTLTLKIASLDPENTSRIIPLLHLVLISNSLDLHQAAFQFLFQHKNYINLIGEPAIRLAVEHIFVLSRPSFAYKLHESRALDLVPGPTSEYLRRKLRLNKNFHGRSSAWSPLKFAIASLDGSEHSQLQHEIIVELFDRSDLDSQELVALLSSYSVEREGLDIILRFLKNIPLPTRSIYAFKSFYLVQTPETKIALLTPLKNAAKKSGWTDQEIAFLTIGSK